MQYQKTFIKEIKSLLSYFVEFQDDVIILSKECLEDCTINKPNQ